MPLPLDWKLPRVKGHTSHSFRFPQSPGAPISSSNLPSTEVRVRSGSACTAPCSGWPGQPELSEWATQDLESLLGGDWASQLILGAGASAQISPVDGDTEPQAARGLLCLRAPPSCPLACELCCRVTPERTDQTVPGSLSPAAQGRNLIKHYSLVRVLYPHK